MDNMRELTDNEKNLVGGLGTPEEVVYKIGEAESNGDVITAYNIAYDATEYGIVDLRDKVSELRERIKEFQRNILDSNPMGTTVIRTDGLFDSVCCQELKEAILNENVGISVDCLTNIPCIVVSGEELVMKVTGCIGSNDDDYCETDECPFCGKAVYDYLVEPNPKVD